MIVASASIDMLDNDKLSPIFRMLELLSKPEHLLNTAHRVVISRALTVIIQCINGQNGDLVVQVDSVITTNFKCLKDFIYLLLL